LRRKTGCSRERVRLVTTKGGAGDKGWWWLRGSSSGGKGELRLRG
jgi:hypothetical protein